MIKSSIIAAILTIIFYLVFLFLYLQDVIGELMFLCVLFIGLMVLLLSLFVFRKKRYTSIAVIVLFLLFCYEFLLLGLTTPTHLVNLYVEPTEAIEGSGLFLLPVQVITISNKQEFEEILTTRKRMY